MRQSRASNNQTELLSIVQSIQRHLESTRKQQNRITPAIARTFAMKMTTAYARMDLQPSHRIHSAPKLTISPEC